MNDETKKATETVLRALLVHAPLSPGDGAAPTNGAGWDAEDDERWFTDEDERKEGTEA